MTPPLSVIFEDQCVGQIWLDQQRRWIFQYDTSWVKYPESFPISVGLGVQEAAFQADAARSFFANLLPEGNIRQRIAAKLGISAGNEFALLAAIGGDCAGALSLQAGNAPTHEKGSYQPISNAELSQLIRTMSQRPLLTADGRARLSLAGAQEKLPVYCKSKSIFIPEGGAVSSHILKPSIPELLDTVHNELFCMVLAKKMGLSVPEVKLWPLDSGTVFMVTRYDRRHHSDGIVNRLHQEDFCQALGLMPDQKYQNEGGPSFADCTTLLNLYSSQPALDKQQLIGWAIFNFLIGNCDAHAKNISLMIFPGGIRLAPFYDIMSTVVYEGLSDKLAMKIGNHYERDKIFECHWRQFAEEVGVKAGFVIKMVRDYFEKMPKLAASTAKIVCNEFGGEKIIKNIVNVISKKAKQL